MDVLREGLRTFRFHGRYYTDSFQHSYGHAARLYVADVIADSPADPAQYQRWLGALRVLCMFKERDAEDYVYEVSSGSELMRLGLGADWVDARAHPTGLPARLRGRTFGVHYMINLDSEVFTLDYCLHWKLSSIPRRRDEWLRAIVPSIYRDTWTISLDICPEELVTSPALQLPEADPTIAFESRRVSPKVEIKEAWAVFLTHSLAVTLNSLRFEIVNFGREWSPDSFLFRELMFVLVSMASNRAVFHDSGARPLPRSPSQQDGDDLSLVHDTRQVEQTRLEDEWVGRDTPLEFGSMFHRPGKPPGASPAETIYWLEGVLVSLELVPDGKAVTKPIRWGIERRHASFQAVILSLFEAVFVEVLEGYNDEILVKVSDRAALSPIRAEWCMSTHPREQPPLTDGALAQPHPGKMKPPADCVATPKKLQENFPGLAALVNFFDVAANRRAVVGSQKRLPSELCARILDFVDHDTWKACLVVSKELRFHCLRRYPVGHRSRIVGGPFMRSSDIPAERMSFNIKSTRTGKTSPMSPLVFQHGPRAARHNWKPVIGDERKVIMWDVCILFEPTVYSPLRDAGEGAIL